MWALALRPPACGRERRGAVARDAVCEPRGPRSGRAPRPSAWPRPSPPSCSSSTTASSHSTPRTSRRARSVLAAAAGRDPPAGRDLVLHVHGDQLRRGRLPGRDRAGARWLRRVPVPGVLPAPRRRADRAAVELIPQLDVRRDPRTVDVARRVWLIMGGLFKKVVIADFLASRSSTRCSATRPSTAPWRPLFAVYGYAVADLLATSAATPTSRSASPSCSASSSRRTSTAPYSAAIDPGLLASLAHDPVAWLRDYLYIPLGGSREAPAYVPRT